MTSGVLGLRQSTISLLYLGLGIALAVYAIGLWTDAISIRPPAILIFAISVGLFAWGMRELWNREEAP